MLDARCTPLSLAFDRAAAETVPSLCAAALTCRHASAIVPYDPQAAILVVVNPHGGRGTARRVAEGSVLPMLRAAGITVEVLETERAGSCSAVAFCHVASWPSSHLTRLVFA